MVVSIDILIYFYFMLMGALSTCMPMHHVHVASPEVGRGQ